MADEVAMLMGNLKFSEEELSKMESDGLQCKEQSNETERWVIAKLFTLRKVEGTSLIRVFYSVWKDQPLEEALDLGSNFFLFKFVKLEDKDKPVGEEGPYQFGDWLRALMVRKKPSQGVKKQGIVYTDKDMGGLGNGCGRGQSVENINQVGLRGGGSGQTALASRLKNRCANRVLLGKYEVCTPIGSKKARSSSCSLVLEEEGGSEVVSPLKTTSVAEAMEQPRRKP
ncbi:hypothetical protein V6N12_008176 [Hibiscus sabdariffa]|uniref:DUF4283 domain-containing protein n=1 Tax=Hibiscus sabdariffa TaxID=183260 RepID=A0ABR2B2Z8_9ROSI